MAASLYLAEISIWADQYDFWLRKGEDGGERGSLRKLEKKSDLPALLKARDDGADETSLVTISFGGFIRSAQAFSGSAEVKNRWKGNYVPAHRRA